MYRDTTRERIKSFAYVTQPQRLIVVAENRAIFEGRHEAHTLRYVDGRWTCTCVTYWDYRTLPGGGWCRHTVAVKYILAVMRRGFSLPVRHAAVMHSDARRQG